MSHYSVSRIRITDPSREVLLRALTHLAEKLGGRVVENAVVRGWGFSRKVDFLLAIELPYGNGYGVELTSEGFIIHVDDHGAPLSGREFAKELRKWYVAEATKVALEEMGYTNIELREEGDEIVVVGQEGWSTGW